MNVGDCVPSGVLCGNFSALLNWVSVFSVPRSPKALRQNER